MIILMEHVDVDKTSKEELGSKIGGGTCVEHQQLKKMIRKAKHGNREAFEELVRLYKGKVYRHALAMVRDPLAAEDITQEAFVKAFFQLRKLEEEVAFVAWLTRIVRNLCLDYLKKAKRETTTDDVWLEQPESSATSQSEGQSVNRLMIQEGLSRLSLEHREVIILRDIQGFSYQEIADQLNIPLGTVKSRINIARTSLKSFLLEGEEG
ncbi:sigma-70 family RNA polymerase sigma factor [Pullulanibacillus sp. KACC 23026]|uniref:RNA polymerase sigma factor n=1 Tax=Pullulanibacillus sp. KACC 23026 TaxID=3028315 RepID=UPI0023AF2752|nr:sigma-70 family RNA polymerase sigma factor [Pullulanibacillus sp. KACC 23026]WEG11976.1 sigma-70 family RNA polymerase sigma factor [Pullulanibacillus sp. KACC 23026]